MPLDEATLKSQLDRANTELVAWVKTLESQGVAAERRKNPKWRELNATCNSLRGRLKAVAAVKAREEEAAQRKTQKLEAALTEKAEPKKSAKPPKAAAKDKDKGKGEPKKEPKGEKAEKGAEAKVKKKKA
jgi:hypothetical protein